MEGISQREDVILGYNPITQGRESDVDFSDVFGGPPRRCSTQSGDSNNEREEEGSSSSSPWMRLREKPVFGEVVTTGVRRRYTSDDFFDDIFRGDQPSSSCSQSPRVSYMSAPGSRITSPSRSLPPAPAFATPSKFSLPSHVVTNTEFAASTSMNNQSPPLSRFNQTMQNHHDGGGYHSSPRSSVFPLLHHDSTESTSSRPSTHLDGNVKGSDFPIYATDFHFSIYKWGTKSVPLVVSLRKKNPISNKATKLEPPCPSDSTTEKVYISNALFSANIVRPPVKQGEQHRNHSFESPITTDPKPKEDIILSAESNPAPIVRPSVAKLTTKDTGFVVHTSNDPPKPLSETTSKLRPLSSLLNDVNAGSEKIGTRNIGDEMNRVVEKEKASSIADVLNRRINRNKVQKSSPTTKKEGSNSKASGTVVKDFVKIFNKESPSKVWSHGVHRSDSKKWKDTKPIENDQEVRFSTVRMEDENEAAYVNWEETCPDTVEMEDGFPSETQQFHVDDIGCEPQIAELSSSSSVNAPNVDSIRDSAPNNNNAACNDEVMSKEVTKGYESKVSQWSKGKEGNIRALLSTLQYVLWAESGWKPVPLVDIIEANAVKRAYQKALLRLHPDKLQQKGTAPHHKFIAEKVFDILQEAWDQFNSLGSL